MKPLQIGQWRVIAQLKTGGNVYESPRWDDKSFAFMLAVSLVEGEWRGNKAPFVICMQRYRGKGESNHDFPWEDVRVWRWRERKEITYTTDDPWWSRTNKHGG